MGDSDIDENDQNVGFLYKAMRNRPPGKRQVKPVQKHLLQVNFGGDDSDNDSDYQVKNSELSDDDEQELETEDDDYADDNDEEADDYKESEDNQEDADSLPKSQRSEDESIDDSGSCSSDSSSDSSDDEDSNDESDGGQRRNLFDVINTDDDEDDEDYVPKKKQKRIEKHVEKQRIRSPVQDTADVEEESSSSRMMKVLICCVCLGDISEPDDEIVECDNCGIAVHEGCYGISDNQSAASTESSASTEPWFCDACKAGVKPDCELCPNEGGLFKETDAGKWVHLVCALYTPGVAFGDVDKLSPVTLFEMPYSKWGLKECSLCEDSRFSRTGVCISCDAGMCRSFFHVTCAQRNGLLSEASPDEDIADPFYAYCKLHADKIASRAKRRNFLAIQSHVRQHAAQGIADEKEKSRFKRKLKKHRENYKIAKAARPPSWVPPQKMIRYLTSSPSVVKKMLRKAELMGIITQSNHVVHTAEKQERKKTQTGAPAFSAEFVTYYLDRNVKIDKMKADLKELEKQNAKLRKQDNALRQEYDKLLKQTEKPQDSSNKLRKEGEKLWSILNSLSKKPLPLPEIYRQKKVGKTPAKKDVIKSPVAVINQCGICKRSHDQHLLARCDKCRLWYHLGCLDPPLTRMPKKTSRWGWQCSECAKSSSEESEESSNVNVDAPRRLREKIKEPAKLSRAQQDMEFLFPNMHGKKATKKKLSKKGVPKKLLNRRETPVKMFHPESTEHEVEMEVENTVMTTPRSPGDRKSEDSTDKSPQDSKEIKTEHTVKVHEKRTSDPRADTSPQNSKEIKTEDMDVKHHGDVNIREKRSDGRIDRSSQKSKEIKTDDMVAKHQADVNVREKRRSDDKIDRSSHRSQEIKTEHTVKHHADVKVREMRKSDNKIYKPSQSSEEIKTELTVENPHVNVKVQEMSMETAQSSGDVGEIIISDDSSLEVEVKIVEETTPIHKQMAASFHDVSRKGRKIIKKRHYDEDEDESDTSPKQSSSGKKITPEKDGSKRPSIRTQQDNPSQCVTCAETGPQKSMVQCDSCEQWYHLKCLDPPCSRTPKQRGYTWFCEACDLSEESDEDECEDKT